MTMRCEKHVTIMAVLIMGLPGLVSAQSNEPPHNLQVLSQDTSRQGVIGIMRGFNAALGVDCDHCHVEAVAGERDFAADDKPAKNVTRAMMRMTNAINAEYIAAMRADEHEADHEADHDAGAEHDHGDTPVQVQCVTCHRGQEHPYLLPDLLSSVREEAGIEAAVGRYQELRDRYYGSHTYDFSVRSLNQFAERLLANGQADDALTVLELNAGTSPESADVHALMGQALLQRGDELAALPHLERAVALEPGNRRAARLLNRLRGEPDRR